MIIITKLNESHDNNPDQFKVDKSLIFHKFLFSLSPVCYVKSTLNAVVQICCCFVYLQIMGKLELVPFISEGFNIYFPIFVLVLCIATYFEIGQRCLTIIGFQQFVEGDIDDSASTYINDGKQLVIRGEDTCVRAPSSVNT